MKKILVVFGTRPEAVKMAPLVRELDAHGEVFETRVCVTAQHRMMLDQILEAFEIRPHYDLDVMTTGQDLYDITAHVLAGIRPVLMQFAPDLVLVQGDTTTTFVTALAAYYEQIDVGHVEAGLRTGNPYSPYPEEMNRQLTTRLAKFHFAPTTRNRENLLEENIQSAQIAVTGNTVIDALLMVVERLEQDSERRELILENIREAGLDAAIPESGRKIVLVTGHRRESFGAGFNNICEAIRELASKHNDVEFIYPVHLNPKVCGPVRERLGDLPNVQLIEPLGYEAFVALMDRSTLVLTDSGGVQEETTALGTPCFTMRDSTERPVTVTHGTNTMVGADREVILREVFRALDGDSKSGNVPELWDGRTAGRVADVLEHDFLESDAEVTV